MAFSLPVWPLGTSNVGWPVTKSPRFATRTQKAVSGRQLRIADQQNPIWMFTLPVKVLRDDNDVRAGAGLGPGIGFNELRQLASFFAGLKGSLGNFLYSDPTDNVVVGQGLAGGDGTTVNFPFLRQLYSGGFSEPIVAAITDGSAPLNVYLNDVVQPPSNYGFSSALGLTGVADTIVFNSAPGNGVAVAADFSYFFLCHFTDDSMDLENFLYQLWQAKEVKFESVLI